MDKELEDYIRDTYYKDPNHTIDDIVNLLNGRLEIRSLRRTIEESKKIDDGILTKVGWDDVLKRAKKRRK